MTCLSNLNQIGQAMSLYANAYDGNLPQVATWSGMNAEKRTSPFYTMRMGLKLGDFVDVAGQLKSEKPLEFKTDPERVGGLRCPSDRVLSPNSATNYRANAGHDARGETGPFAIGQSIRMQQIEAADGLSYTAAFGERLIGTGNPIAGLANYYETEECQSAISMSVLGRADKAVVRSDAGHHWSIGDWQNTLYHHGMTPNWPRSAIAKSGRCGQMGLSSGHQNFVHVLLMDGSAREWRDSVDAIVWKRLGSFKDNGTK